MGALLKYWRESASLILASKQLSKIKTSNSTANDGIISKIFGKKNTSSSPDTEEQELLRLLYVRRSSASAYLPNVYVFPGGMVDDSDFSKEWLNVFCYNSGAELSLLFKRGKEGSSIFSRKREPQFKFVPSEIALRVTAIRETFEESGVLVARSVGELEKLGTPSLEVPTTGSVFKFNEKDLQNWRTKVIEEPSQFVNMCKDIGAVPDIWSLYEWSNWLTPLLHKTHRFDTAFFVCCIDEGPRLEGNNSETDHGVWMEPATMLQGSIQGSVSIAPPQMYEMCRFIRFENVEDLLSLAYYRAKNRSERWMPVIHQCKDGLMFLLPGDELYPEDPDVTGEKNVTNEIALTYDELSDLHPQQNRAFISYKTNQISLTCNLDYIEGHMLPISFDEKKTFDNEIS